MQGRGNENREKKSLYYRQKILLALLEVFDGRLRKADLQKYLFLFTQEYQQKKNYEFIPYKFGCFSFQSNADLKKLTNIGIIKDGECWELADRGSYSAQITTKDRKNLTLFKDKYKSLKGNNLIRYIYHHYPYYAINSEIAEKLIMDKEELRRTEQKKTFPDRSCIFYY